MTDGKDQAGQRYAPAPAQPARVAVRGDTGTACRSCQHRNTDGATYCEECGQALGEPVRCADCQSVAHPGADICEACGTWLLSGQCMFCYAPVLDGESFCGQCGNPAGGITCPQCAQPSIFDFCKSCGVALSEQARSAIAEVAQDPGMQAFAGLASSLAALGITTDAKPPASASGLDITASRDAAASLRAYRDSIRDSTPAAPSRKATSGLLSETQKARIEQLNDAIADETKRREEEAERQRIEAERQRLEAERKRAQALQRQREMRDQLLAELRALGNKTFWTHQEARRFAMALLSNLPPELLAELKRSGLGWRCNAYDCIHNTPSECADPSKGGVWLLR